MNSPGLPRRLDRIRITSLPTEKANVSLVIVSKESNDSLTQLQDDNTAEFVQVNSNLLKRSARKRISSSPESHYSTANDSVILSLGKNQQRSYSICRWRSCEKIPQAAEEDYGWYEDCDASYIENPRPSEVLSRLMNCIHAELMSRVPTGIQEIYRVTLDLGIYVKDIGKDSVFAWSIISFRVVSTEDGKRAQFEIVVLQQNVIISCWKRHSDFKKLAEYASRQGFSECKNVWSSLLRHSPWFRCLDTNFLNLKAIYFGIFLQKFMLECEDEKVLNCFIEGTL